MPLLSARVADLERERGAREGKAERRRRRRRVLATTLGLERIGRVAIYYRGFKVPGWDLGRDLSSRPRGRARRAWCSLSSSTVLAIALRRAATSKRSELFVAFAEGRLCSASVVQHEDG